MITFKYYVGCISRDGIKFVTSYGEDVHDTEFDISCKPLELSRDAADLLAYKLRAMGYDSIVVSRSYSITEHIIPDNDDVDSFMFYKNLFYRDAMNEF